MNTTWQTWIDDGEATIARRRTHIETKTAAGDLKTAARHQAMIDRSMAEMTEVKARLATMTAEEQGFAAYALTRNPGEGPLLNHAEYWDVTLFDAYWR